MRKSIKVAPGVRLNVSKTGVGASVGGRGGRYSVHSSGRRTVSVGSGIVPGVYYQRSEGGGRSTRAATGGATHPAKQPKPGIFAPGSEKRLYKAIRSQDPKAIQQVGDSDPSYRLVSYSLAGLMFLDKDESTSEKLLDGAFEIGSDPAVNPFVTKYLYTHVTLDIADGITAELPISRDAVGLALAELKQQRGDVTGAIDVVEQLEPTSYSAVSLAELYAVAGRWPDVVELTDGVRNEDDATALLCVFRGEALREQGFNDAAHEALKEALRSRSRPATIRHRALYQRAQNYLAVGKRSMARKDLERILAEDSTYEGVREQLAELTAPGD